MCASRTRAQAIVRHQRGEVWRGSRDRVGVAFALSLGGHRYLRHTLCATTVMSVSAVSLRDTSLTHNHIQFQCIVLPQPRCNALPTTTHHDFPPPIPRCKRATLISTIATTPHTRHPNCEIPCHTQSHPHTTPQHIASCNHIHTYAIIVQPITPTYGTRATCMIGIGLTVDN